MVIKIDYKKCCWKDNKCASCSCNSKCTGCVEVCPVKALKRGKKVTINQKKCTGCGACIKSCKHHAISMD